MRVVLPVKDQARWFLAELAQEAQRRGSELVTAASLHEKTPYDTMNDRCREDQEFLPIGHIVIPQTGGSDA